MLLAIYPVERRLGELADTVESSYQRYGEKARLLAEGLFDPEHKQPLPQFPHTIGLVTSRDGAALRDILTTLRRRMPLVRVILYPTLVQGAAAAAEIARGIRTLNKVGGIDVMIIGRGGGSPGAGC